MNQFTPLTRYQPILDDWPAFCQALNRPLPACIWANALRVTPERLAGILTAEGIAFEPLAWYPGGFKLPPEFRPGRHWAYLAGLYQVQEEAALLPVRLLDPRPGERVLDLCAAPGNKTAQMAVLMGNQGTVVANDINYGRMRAARNALERLGLVNVSTTIYDAANYPGAAGQFDKVLVDVPCSCEGTSRKEPAVLGRIGPAVSARRQSAQVAMLRKAIQLCKPGGRIVYATCTYAPEENEQVVDILLHEFSFSVRLVPADLAGFSTTPGLTGWAGASFEPSLRHARRIWPHHNDTGGFFVAVLEKLGPAVRRANFSLPPCETRINLPQAEAAETEAHSPPASLDLVEHVLNRFGLSFSASETAIIFQGSKKRRYLANSDQQPPARPAPDALGLAFINTHSKYPKLTTAAAMLLGSEAKQNFIELDEKQRDAYLDRQEVTVSAGQARACTGPGYVLVRYQGFTLGVGVYRPDSGLLESMFPKGWAG